MIFSQSEILASLRVSFSLIVDRSVSYTHIQFQKMKPSNHKLGFFISGPGTLTKTVMQVGNKAKSRRKGAESYRVYRLGVRRPFDRQTIQSVVRHVSRPRYRLGNTQTVRQGHDSPGCKGASREQGVCLTYTPATRDEGHR